MVQPPALPGSVGWAGRGFREILDLTLREAEVLVKGGVDALMVQNLWDGPGGLETLSSTVAMVTRVTSEIRDRFDAPLGVSLMTNDAAAALSVAVAAGADFVRLKVYIGLMIRGDGLVVGNAGKALAARRRLGAVNLKILADVHDRSGIPLGEPPLADSVKSAVWSMADGLVICGKTTDETLEMLSVARAASASLPIFIGGGSNPTNVASLLERADGIIVGAHIKAHGQDANPVDPGRLAAYMDAVYEARGK